MRSWHGNLSPFGQWHTGGRAFSPASLFALSQPGLWLDPSDVANLDWRRNLLTWTEQFDNAAWVKLNSTVTANAVAPDGTNTADAIVEDATAAAPHRVNINGINVENGATYAFSTYAKAQNVNFLFLNCGSTFFGSNNAAVFNISTGVVVSATGGTASIQNVGSGWYRCVFVVTAIATGASQFFINPTDNSSSISYTGVNGRASALIWGAQLELGTTATEYQRITDVNTEVRERFPTATLYQDTAGTQPVTTPGQTVALALDKSRGLVLGPELVTNGDFANGGAGWINDATWTFSGGTANISSGGAANPGLSRAGVFPASRWVRYSFTVSNYVSGAISLRCYGSGGNDTIVSVTANGTYSGLYFTRADATGLFGFSQGSGVTLSLDNISVRELAGNHATQSTAAARPIYGIHPFGGRRNLLLATDAPVAGAGTTVTANAALAPDGTNNAARVAKTDATTPRYVSQSWASQTALPNSAYTVSRFVKYDGFDTTVSLEYNQIGNFGVNWVATFSVTASGVTANTPTLCTSAVQNVGNGWHRLIVNLTSGASPTTSVVNVLTRVTGASGTSVLMYGAQLETGSVATPYQRVTTQYDVTEAGVPSVSYLFFDGIDNFMVTPTITPNIDKVQVFAGVRKLSDAAAGIVAELSADLTVNNGTFDLRAPNSTSPSYWFRSKGANVGNASVSSGYAAPISNVLTGIGDISGDLATLRVNGTQVAQSTADQQTGNFLAYPLYIGMRGGSSLPFFGHLYGLIVRFGANLEPNVITQTEQWMGPETGFFRPSITGAPTVGVS